MLKKTKEMPEVLSGDYIAGLVDGEGCFALNFRRDRSSKRKGKPEYFYRKVQIAIVLRADDKPLLEKVRDALGCGSIYLSPPRKRQPSPEVRYQVADLKDLKEKIVPFFLNNPLRSKKHEDFVLWAEAVDILYRNKGTPVKKGELEFQRLLEIAKEMKSYKSKGAAWKWGHPP
jgi:hypothetical protein